MPPLNEKGGTPMQTRRLSVNPKSETNLNLVTAVLCLLGRRIVRLHQHLLGAPAYRLDVARIHPLRDQLLDHHLRTARRQSQVLCRSTRRVGVARHDEFETGLPL